MNTTPKSSMPSYSQQAMRRLSDGAVNGSVTSVKGGVGVEESDTREVLEGMEIRI